MVSLDQQGVPSIIEGALVKADQKHLHIDKLDKMTPELRVILETAMEQHYYPIAKNGVTTCLNTRVSILATANPTLGRYNPYQTLAQNINLPVGLLSCFDLIFVIRDHPDNLKDRVIAEKILEMVDTGLNENENLIDQSLLCAYITEASKVEPVLSQVVKTRLRDFYLDIRRASEEGDAISITPRQLLSLVRLSEARAKLHLRENVSGSDVEAAIRIFSESLEQVGIDPVTHHYDIDVLYTGRPTVLNSKLLKVVEVFSELEKISARVSETDLHGMLFERYGMNRRTVARLLRTLVKEGIITCKSPGVYMRNG
jgi:replicative DNA helicase Mcm